MADDRTVDTTNEPETGTAREKQAPDAAESPAPKKKAAAKKTTARKTAAKKASAKKKAAPEGTDETARAVEAVEGVETPAAPVEGTAEATDAAAEDAPAKKPARKRAATKKTAAKKAAAPAPAAEPAADAPAEGPDAEGTATDAAADEPAATGTLPLFQAPEKAPAKPRKKAAAKPKTAKADRADRADRADKAESSDETGPATDDAKGEAAEPAASAADASDARGDAGEADATGDKDRAPQAEDGEESGDGGSSSGRRRRRRGGRRRRKPGSGNGDDTDNADNAEESDDRSDGERSDAEGAAAVPAGDEKSDGEQGEGDTQGQGGSSSSRRRRRRRREGDAGDGGDDPNTVTRVRKPRSPEDEITAVSGSTRLEAKKQRRREGREAGRRRAPIVSEAEFLARRESVDRVMVVRQRKDLTQIGVLEDKVLVEHYVARESQTSLIGNVYLGRVQNVLPSMEAAFIDIGKGRNAVLYAGEVNWSALGHKEGTPRKIESVLQSGQPILVQVTKDPVGHKGARLTSQVSLAGRFLVYVPDGTTSGISRKLPDTERARLKSLLKEIVPESAGVIVRTAAEGASEEELTRDVERLKTRWEAIEKKVAKGNAPQLLYGEPDLTLKVVRDLFTEDFSKLVIQGDEVWKKVSEYVGEVAPDLADRLEKFDTEGGGAGGADVFGAYRIDEQIAKGLDRKVWLPSGGSLVIDRTEAMTVVDVNTGKFTGSGGNLEETVTKNNLEAAEEIVRQLRLRDIGGIIVVDFIDMVLESNRDLVLRRLVECLGRDRTRHQVAEVTSLGLVQMTRKRIGTGLLESFSETCSHCQGRGLVVHDLPVAPRGGGGGNDDESRRSRRRRGKGQSEGGDNGSAGSQQSQKAVPSPKDVAAMAKPPAAEDEEGATADAATPAVEEESPVEPVVADVVESVEAESEVPHTQPEGGVVPPTPEPEPEPAPVPEPTPEPAPDAEPVPAPDPEPAAPPKVVTRTRRRAASRPAGPPPQAAEQATEPASDVPEPAQDEPHVEHVPIKKKGARKR